jgi:hypothetical protein
LAEATSPAPSADRATEIGGVVHDLYVGTNHQVNRIPPGSIASISELRKLRSYVEPVPEPC